MRKTVIMLIIMSWLGASAQVRTKGGDDLTYGMRPIIGLRAGANFPSMHYTDHHLDDLPKTTIFKPMVGVFVEFPVNKCLSIAPEAVLEGRGVQADYTHYSGAEVKYSIDAYYADLRLPITMRFPLHKCFQPYVFGGPDVGMLLFGNIREDRTGAGIDDSFEVEANESNMASLHAAAFAGVGIRCDVRCGRATLALKVDAAYSFGLIDTYSDSEHTDAAHSMNINAYNVNGRRVPKGLELSFSIGIPLKLALRDVCTGWGNKKYYYRKTKGTTYGY